MRLPVGEPGWESMQACMGISSLTTISSRQTGCGMLASM
jgi:hypothetical protein